MLSLPPDPRPRPDADGDNDDELLAAGPGKITLAALVTAAALAGFAGGWLCRPVELRPASFAPPAAGAAANKPARPARSAPASSADAFEAALAEPVLYRQNARLSEAVAGLGRDAVIAAVEQEQARGADRRPKLLAALFSRLAELDPRTAAVRAAAAFDDGRDPAFGNLMAAALEPWLARDRPAAEKWWNGLSRGPLRDAVSRTFLDLLARTDPRDALQLALANGQNDPRSDLVQNIFGRLAARDPREAAEQARLLSGQAGSWATLERVVAVWAAKDPAGAYAWIEQVPDISGLERVRGFMGIYQTWSLSDPAGAGAWLLARSRDAKASGDLPAGYSGALAEVVGNNWALKDPRSALAWASQLPAGRGRSYGSFALKGILSGWGERDPAAAADYAASLPDQGAEKRTYLYEIVKNWTKTDVNAAQAWASQLPAGDQRKEVIYQVTRNWFERDPQAALEFALRESDVTGGSYAYLMGEWVKMAPDKAVAWCQALPDPRLRDALLGGAVTAMTDLDPARGLALFAQVSPESQPATASRLLETWGARDPAAASKWTATLPPGATHDAALASLAKYWGYQDPPAACAWLAAQPADDARDRAVVGMIAYLESNTRDSAPAIPLAESIQDPASRGKALENIARSWLRRDAAAAGAWIAQTPDFTPAQRARLTAPGG